jgi:hypothetical protein
MLDRTILVSAPRVETLSVIVGRTSATRVFQRYGRFPESSASKTGAPVWVAMVPESPMQAPQVVENAPLVGSNPTENWPLGTLT